MIHNFPFLFSVATIYAHPGPQKYEIGSHNYEMSAMREIELQNSGMFKSSLFQWKNSKEGKKVFIRASQKLGKMKLITDDKNDSFFVFYKNIYTAPKIKIFLTMLSYWLLLLQIYFSQKRHLCLWSRGVKREMRKEIKGDNF